MSRFWRYRIPRVPNVAWYVMGRKILKAHWSDATRASWGCGNYGVTP